MASLGQELKNLPTGLKEHPVNAVGETQKSLSPNQRGIQNATRLCEYFTTNGHTPSFCRKKIREEEIKRLENEATIEKRVTFTHDYNKRRGNSHRSGNWTSWNNADETQRSTAYDKQPSFNGALMSISQPYTRGNFRPSNQNSNIFRQNRHFERSKYPKNNNNRYNDYRARSHYQPDQGQFRNWGSNNSYARSPQRRDKIHPSQISANNLD